MHFIGYLAGVLSIITLIPQIIKIYKTKSTKDLSIMMIIILNSSVLLWALYGIYLKNIPMIITNSIIFISTLLILLMILIYRKNNE